MHSHVGIVISYLEVKVFHQVAHTNFNISRTLTAEGTLLFKHLLVVLLGSFCPGVSDFPGNFFSDAIPGTDDNVSLHTVDWMFFMAFGLLLWLLHSIGSSGIAKNF